MIAYDLEGVEYQLGGAFCVLLSYATSWGLMMRLTWTE